MRIVVAISGASGSIYGIRLLEHLQGEKILVVSSTAKQILEHETGYRVADVYAMADQVFEDNDLFASIASGSYPCDAVVVAPCSMSTMAKVAHGIADTLITRSASVALKERRLLIMVPRETPKSAVMLENEMNMVRYGAVVLDANPGFYCRPGSVDDMVNFVVGKILDQLGQSHELYQRWK
ncbi:MAG: UbiX family flavin prenyltransferase [Candidatus Methanomethylophilaceae archaeon]